MNTESNMLDTALKHARKHAGIVNADVVAQFREMIRDNTEAKRGELTMLYLMRLQDSLRKSGAIPL